MVCIQEISYRLLYCDIEQEFPVVFPAKTPENYFSFISVFLQARLPQTTGEEILLGQ